MNGGSGINLSKGMPMTLGAIPSPFLTRRRGGSYVRGEKPVIDTRPDRSLPAHSRHNAYAADKLAAIMRILALDDYDLPGSHTPSLIFSDSQKVIEPASYGQPENIVGKVWFFYRCLNERIRCLCGSHREQAHSHKGSVFAFRPSPLNRPSVSSPAALDLDPPAPSGG